MVFWSFIIFKVLKYSTFSLGEIVNVNTFYYFSRISKHNFNALVEPNEESNNS